MGLKRRFRASVATMAVLGLLAAALIAPAVASACEENQIVLPAIARGYYYIPGPGTYLHFLDGVVTNDSSVTVSVDKVLVGWAESPSTASTVWVGCSRLEPGQWTTFHTEWPGEAQASWTPGIVRGIAYKTDARAPIALTVEGTASAPAEDGMRIYMAKIKNTSPVTVSSIDVIGREMAPEFVDTLFSWDIPDELAPGESAYVKVRGKAYGLSPSVHAEMRFVALEKPTITLTPDTLSPVYGTPITFRIELRRSDGSLAAGCRTLKIYHSFDGEEWAEGYFHQETNDGTVITQITPDRPTYYRAVYWGGDDLGSTMNEWMLATPKVANSAPVVAGSVRAKKAFPVAGRIGAGIGSAGKGVTIFAEKKVGRRWVRKVKVAASADSTGAYKRSLKLTARGTWRIRAYRAGAGYSKYRTVKVR